MRLATVGVLLLALWAVSGGDEAKTGPTSAVTADDLRRIKAVLSKGLELKDPVLTSYSVLANSILKLETEKAGVSRGDLFVQLSRSVRIYSLEI